MPRQKLFRRRVGQITRRENVRYQRSGLTRNPPALGQMRLDEGAMLSPQLAKWMQCFDHACPLSPPAPRSRCQRYHRDRSILERGKPGSLEI